jgi:hypothetical protein
MSDLPELTFSRSEACAVMGACTAILETSLVNGEPENELQHLSLRQLHIAMLKLALKHDIALKPEHTQAIFITEATAIKMRDTSDEAETEMLFAGREADCMLAERLGWSEIASLSSQWDDRPNVSEWFGVPPAQEHRLVIPRYSTEVDAALTALASFPAYEIKRWERGGRYFVFITVLHGDPWGIPEASDESLALAICKSILLATQPHRQRGSRSTASGTETPVSRGDATVPSGSR